MNPTIRYMHAIMAVRPPVLMHGAIEPRLAGLGPQGAVGDSGRGALTERQKRRLEFVRYLAQRRAEP